ncbi:MAG: hypothetical protein MPJ50_09230 [Pirellulales bacterium]|nr:hypothetical protein [Pirellulales bacterium]
MSYFTRIAIAVVALSGAIACGYASVVAGDILPGGGAGVGVLAIAFSVLFLLCLVMLFAKWFRERKQRAEVVQSALPEADPSTTNADQGEAKKAYAFGVSMLLSGLTMAVLGALGFTPRRFGEAFTPGAAMGCGLVVAVIGGIALAVSRSEQSTVNATKIIKWILYAVIVAMVLAPIGAVLTLIFES